MNRRISATVLLLHLLLSCSAEVEGPVNTDGFADGFADGIDLSSHRLFISSTTTNGLIGSTGLSGADAFCTSLAQSAGLKREYRALLSTVALNLKDRFTSTAAVYGVGPSGAYRVTSNLNSNLATGGATLENAISHTELLGSPTGIRAWTGSNSVGVHTSSCSSWASANVGLNATTGFFSQTTKSWIAGGGSPNCSDTLHLYCISAAWSGSAWVF